MSSSFVRTRHSGLLLLLLLFRQVDYIPQNMCYTKYVCRRGANVLVVGKEDHAVVPIARALVVVAMYVHQTKNLQGERATTKYVWTHVWLSLREDISVLPYDPPPPPPPLLSSAPSRCTFPPLQASRNQVNTSMYVACSETCRQCCWRATQLPFRRSLSRSACDACGLRGRLQFDA